MNEAPNNLWAIRWIYDEDGKPLFGLDPEREARRAEIREEVERMQAAEPAEWYPGTWYRTATAGHLGAERLRKAARRGTINGEKRGGRWHYEFGSVFLAYPECRKNLTAKRTGKRTEAAI